MFFRGLGLVAEVCQGLSLEHKGFVRLRDSDLGLRLGVWG